MKKTLLWAALVAVAALFLLAGCDAMLEAIYPDQTSHGTTLYSFNVSATPNAVNPVAAQQLAYNQVWVDLIDAGTGQVVDVTNGWLSAYADSSGNIIVSEQPYQAAFSVPQGSYYALVWIDTNGNGQYDPLDEYGVYSVTASVGPANPTATVYVDLLP